VKLEITTVDEAGVDEPRSWFKRTTISNPRALRPSESTVPPVPSLAEGRRMICKTAGEGTGGTIVNSTP
jgi:hypothetical protein